MLYGNESISHYSRANVAVWMVMAFQAGLINIGGFLACHRFVSHVTGFSTHFGHEISKSKFAPALGMLAVPLFFLLGAMTSGLLVDLRLKLHQKPRYYIAFGFIFALIALAFVGGTLGHFGPFGESLDRPRDFLLLAILCFACGVQNGTITSVSRSVVRTTHLTGITTDLGLGLIRFLYRRELAGSSDEEAKANLMRIGIIGFFGLGSVIGAFAFSRLGYGGFAIPLSSSGALFGSMLYFQLFKTAK